jgi:hypothetical protein
VTADARPAPPPLGRGDRFTVWTMRSSLRHSVVLGVYGGVVFGLLQGIQSRSVGRGLFEGVFFGVLFGAMTSRTRNRKMRTLTGLPQAETWRLLTAVQTGHVPDEPVLAGAVLVWVGQIRKVQRTSPWAWVVYGLFAAAAAAWLAIALVESARASAVTAGLTLVLWTFVVIRVPRRRVAAIAKADRAEATALAVLGRYNGAQ